MDFGECIKISVVAAYSFQAENQMGVMMAHVENPVPRIQDLEPRASVPDEVNHFLSRVMAKDRDDRPASALELKRELLRLLGARDDRASSALSGTKTDPQIALRRTTSHDIDVTVQTLQFVPPLGTGTGRETGTPVMGTPSPLPSGREHRRRMTSKTSQS